MRDLFRKSACVVVAVVSVVAFAPGHAGAADGYAMVNAARAGRGLPALRADGTLAAMAQRQAQRMSGARQIFHNQSLVDEITASGRDWRHVGENVAVSRSLDAAQQGFMASPEHHRNIVDPRYTDLGVGVATDADGHVWVAQVFAAFDSATADPVTQPVAGPQAVTVPQPVTVPPRVTAPQPLAVRAPAPAPAVHIAPAARETTTPAIPPGAIRLEDGSFVPAGYLDVPACSDEGWIGSGPASYSVLTSFDEHSAC